VRLARRALGHVGLDQHAPRLVEHRRAGIGEGDVAVRAGEQRDTELVLELADLLADGRLRDVQPLGCPTEMQLLRDGHEVLQMPEFHE